MKPLEFDDFKKHESHLKFVREQVDKSSHQVITEAMLAPSEALSVSSFEESPDMQIRSPIYAEKKHDGVRARILDGKLIDRRGNDITKRFPEFRGIENVSLPLDGEIVAQSGEFEDIAGRMHLKDKFKIRLSSKKSPAVFAVFDIPVNGVPFEARKAALFEFFDSRAFITTWMQRVETYEIQSNKELLELWGSVRHKDWEGLMLKESNHYYRGGRQGDWMKVKNFVTKVKEFDTYEKHNRGVKLIQSDSGRSVNVNGHKASKVRKAIDQNGSVSVWVRYMEQSRTDRWRFPSFKGVANE